jgi:hypothetical protein
MRSRPLHIQIATRVFQTGTYICTSVMRPKTDATKASDSEIELRSPVRSLSPPQEVLNQEVPENNSKKWVSSLKVSEDGWTELEDQVLT